MPPAEPLSAGFEAMSDEEAQRRAAEDSPTRARRPSISGTLPAHPTTAVLRHYVEERRRQG